MKSTKQFHCPLCGISAASEHHLQKHINGSSRYGGHDGMGRTDQPSPVPRPALSEPADPLLRDYLVLLNRWRAVPKYQYERATGTLLALFLPSFLEWKLGGSVTLIAPEFPLKKAGSAQSTNADFLLNRRDPSGQDEWILAELKTDRSSRRDDQLQVYQALLKTTPGVLMRGLQQVEARSAKKQKYRYLRGLIGSSPLPDKVRFVIISQDPEKDAFPEFIWLTFRDWQEMPAPPRWDTQWPSVRDHLIGPLADEEKRSS
ncbi:MAG: hypothetical protein HUU10_12955 [Bacteroidetes bacterium]|nr:hypothetical protein [Bacteroidota bacterium]